MTETSSPAHPPRRWDWHIIIAATFYPSLLTWIYFVLLKNNAPSVQQTAYAIGKFAQFVFPITWIWFFHRDFFKTNKIFGHIGKLSRADLIGIGFGVFVVALMMTVYFGFLSSTEIAGGLVEKVKQKTIGMGIDSTWKFFCLGLFYAICHSFLEEYYWRWFVLGYLHKYFSSTWAVVISSLGFMAHHVILLAVFFNADSPLAYLLAFGVGIGGVVWACLYLYSGSLKASWLSHLVVDAGIFSLGYFLIRPFLTG